MKSETPRVAVQVGAFEDRARADALAVLLSGRYQKLVLIAPTLSAGRTLYRVRILVGTRAEANALALALSRNEKLEAWVVPLAANPRPLRLVPHNLVPSRFSIPSRLVAESLGSREIASSLNLSEHTVENYLFHIFDKLGILNCAEWVLYAVSNPKWRTLSPSPPEKSRRNSAAPY